MPVLDRLLSSLTIKIRKQVATRTGNGHAAAPPARSSRRQEAHFSSAVYSVLRIRHRNCDFRTPLRTSSSEPVGRVPAPGAQFRLQITIRHLPTTNSSHVFAL